jgi:hypothetical protein
MINIKNYELKMNGKRYEICFKEHLLKTGMSEEVHLSDWLMEKLFVYYF